MVGEQAFFQIAAGLIPLLTFGGVLISRPRQLGTYERRTGWERLLGQFLPIFGVIAIGAEVFAISGAVTGKGGDFDRLWVIGTILLSMVVIIATAVHTYSRELGTPALPMGRWPRLGLAIFVVVSLAFTARSFNSIVRLSQVTVELEGEAASLARTVAKVGASRTLPGIQSDLREILDRMEQRHLWSTEVDYKLLPLLGKLHPTSAERAQIILLRGEKERLERNEERDEDLSVSLFEDEAKSYER
jgi:hypothetical protein